MKFNNKELADLSCGEGTIEGRLHHKKYNGGYPHSVFKEKWFKLKANILFYFQISDTGQIFDKKPIGAYILENVIVQYEMNSEVPFSFSFYFNDETEKKHIFASRNQENVNKWVEALKQASYEYWRSQLLLLQEKLKSITGQDPLLMYPRNEGCRHVFAPSDSKKKSNNENFKSKFYTAQEEKLDIDFTIPQNSSNDISKSTVENIISTPPIRPVRGNKPKQEVDCGTLIDI